MDNSPRYFHPRQYQNVAATGIVRNQQPQQYNYYNNFTTQPIANVNPPHNRQASQYRAPVPKQLPVIFEDNQYLNQIRQPQQGYSVVPRQTTHYHQYQVVPQQNQQSSAVHQNRKNLSFPTNQTSYYAHQINQRPKAMQSSQQQLYSSNPYSNQIPLSQQQQGSYNVDPNAVPHQPSNIPQNVYSMQNSQQQQQETYYPYHRQLLSNENNIAAYPPQEQQQYSVKLSSGVVHRYPAPDYSTPPMSNINQHMTNNPNLYHSPVTGNVYEQSSNEVVANYISPTSSTNNSPYTPSPLSHMMNKYDTEYSPQDPSLSPSCVQYRTNVVDSPLGSPLNNQVPTAMFKTPQATPPLQRREPPVRQISNEIYKLDSPSSQLLLQDMSLNSPRPRSETIDMDHPPTLPPRSPISIRKEQHANEPPVLNRVQPTNNQELIPPQNQRLRSGTVEMVEAADSKLMPPPSAQLTMQLGITGQRNRAGTIEMLDSPQNFSNDIVNHPEQRIRSGTVEMCDAPQSLPTHNTASYAPPSNIEQPKIQQNINNNQIPQQQASYVVRSNSSPQLRQPNENIHAPQRQHVSSSHQGTQQQRTVQQNNYQVPPNTSQLQPQYSNTSQPQPQYSNTSQPQSQYSNTSQPQSQYSNTSQPQSQYSNTSQPQSQYSNTSQPQSQYSNTSQPQSQYSNTSQPQSQYSNTSQPQSQYSKNYQVQNNYVNQDYSNSNNQKYPVSNVSNAQAHPTLDQQNIDRHASVSPVYATKTQYSSQATNSSPNNQQKFQKPPPPYVSPQNNIQNNNASHINAKDIDNKSQQVNQSITTSTGQQPSPNNSGIPLIHQQHRNQQSSIPPQHHQQSSTPQYTHTHSAVTNNGTPSSAQTYVTQVTSQLDLNKDNHNASNSSERTNILNEEIPASVIDAYVDVYNNSSSSTTKYSETPPSAKPNLPVNQAPQQPGYPHNTTGVPQTDLSYNNINEAELDRQQKLMQQQYVQRVRQAQLQQQLRQIQNEYEATLQIEQDVAREFLLEQENEKTSLNGNGQPLPSQPRQYLQEHVSPNYHPKPVNQPMQNRMISPTQQHLLQQYQNMQGGAMVPPIGYQQPHQQVPPQSRYMHPQSPRSNVQSQPILIMPGGGGFSNTGQFVPQSNNPYQQQQPIKNNLPSKPNAMPTNQRSGGTRKEQTPFQKLRKIAEDISSFVDDVVKFKGKKGDQEYKYLDEMLTQQLLSLDKISIGTDELRNARKALVKEIQELLEILERRATNKKES